MNPEVMAGIVMGLMVGSFLGHFFTRQFDRKLRHFGIDMGEWEGYRQKRDPAEPVPMRPRSA